MHYSLGPRVIPHPLLRLLEVNFLMVEIPTPKPYIFMIRVTRQIKCLIAQALGDHTHPLPEVNFIMVEIPTPNHIYLWSGKIDKLNAPRVEAWGHPHPLLEVFLRITHFSETTKDRNLIFGMGGDAYVTSCIQHFLSPGLSPTPLGNLQKNHIYLWSGWLGKLNSL